MACEIVAVWISRSCGSPHASEVGHGANLLRAGRTVAFQRGCMIRSMPGDAYRAGDSIEDHCRACKLDRRHTVIADDPCWHQLRVECVYGGSEQHHLAGALTRE